MMLLYAVEPKSKYVPLWIISCIMQGTTPIPFGWAPAHQTTTCYLTWTTMPPTHYLTPFTQLQVQPNRLKTSTT